MVSLDIVSSVAVKTVDFQVLDGLSDGGQKIRRILTGPVSQGHCGDQMAFVMAHDRYFGKSPVTLHSPGTNEEVTADMMILESGGVDGCLGTLLDQAAGLGDTENSFEQPVESPFFKRRAWAF